MGWEKGQRNIGSVPKSNDTDWEETCSERLCLNEAAEESSISVDEICRETVAHRAVDEEEATGLTSLSIQVAETERPLELMAEEPFQEEKLTKVLIHSLMINTFQLSSYRSPLGCLMRETRKV